MADTSTRLGYLHEAEADLDRCQLRTMQAYMLGALAVEVDAETWSGIVDRARAHVLSMAVTA